MGGSFGVLGASFAEPFFVGSCLAAGFFTGGFFEAGFGEAATFFVFRVDFGVAGTFVFALVVATLGFLEADAAFATSGSPECFLEAGAGGFSSMSLGVGASAWVLMGPTARRASWAGRTMIRVSVVMPCGPCRVRVCSEERELPNEAVLMFPLDSPWERCFPFG
ncbi:hypothetical protein PF006_g32659 [Phytophthora fragariae]|uniref:Uncharacterized protein n=1 Tax=Phytophthora fragariae TaxID=53985 RepID=A0A6A3PNV5_9STRA|nr:hypothetical protein PF006_g32659 [Phytophthora fragariae]